MKKIPARRLAWLATLIVVLTLHAGAAVAQAPAWTWADAPGGGNAYVTVSDGAGNVYIAGELRGTAVFGATTLSNTGLDTDTFVAKLTPGGTYAWAVQAQGGENGAYELALSASGDVFLTGSFGSSITLGSTTLTAAGPSDAFVAKLSATGVWQWATSAGGPDADGSTRLTVGTTDDIYVTGFHGAQARFGATTLTGAGQEDVFVAKLSIAGVWQWAISVGGTDDDAGLDVAVDAAGNTYVTGSYASTTLSFGSATLINSGPTAVYRGEIFVAKLSAAGVWQWAVSAGGANDDDVAVRLALDGNANVYIVGQASEGAFFGATQLPANGQGGLDAFVAKLNSAGVWQWVRTTASLNSDNTNSSTDLVVEVNGTVSVCGVFNPTAAFGSTRLTSGGDNNVFVAQLSPTGQWVWATTTTNASNASAMGLAKGRGGSFSLVGYFDSPTLTFGATTVSNPTSPVSEAIFIARLGATGVGLPEATAPTAFTLAPNPAHHTVRLTGASAPTAILLDALGRTVR
ncbi:MAG: hypothetical protein H7330_14105, partial [Hymenobacteraceae bacterium]|nr:hypothetical protein [Hymenobacteraceae bacterium]